MRFDEGDELVEAPVDVRTAFDAEVWPKLEENKDQIMEQIQEAIGVLTVQSEPDFSVTSPPVE